jgi:hypothetical protein
MIYRRHLIQNKLIKALKTLGWLIRWAIQWFLFIATTAFDIKVAGIYPTNSNSSVRFTALFFSTHAQTFWGDIFSTAAPRSQEECFDGSEYR